MNTLFKSKQTRPLKFSLYTIWVKVSILSSLFFYETGGLSLLERLASIFSQKWNWQIGGEKKKKKKKTSLTSSQYLHLKSIKSWKSLFFKCTFPLLKRENLSLFFLQHIFTPSFLSLTPSASLLFCHECSFPQDLLLGCSELFSLSPPHQCFIVEASDSEIATEFISPHVTKAVSTE